VPLERPAEVEVICQGPLMAQLRITRPLHNSEMTQQVTLRRGSACLEFETTIDWDESHKLLKVGFDSNIRTDEAIHEIQFGCLKRPTHRSMPFDRDRYEVANQKYTAVAEARRGLAVLNDCKYGVSVLGGSINLSLLRASKAPDPQADIGRQTFTYAVSIWRGSFADSGIIREGYELNVPPTIAPGRAETTSLLNIDADNVIVEALKPAQDGSGDLILRLYEAVGTATRATLRTALNLSAAAETNMLETDPRELDVCDGSAVTLDFTAFEIKTLRLKPA
jgi:alpha-mannosidase